MRFLATLVCGALLGSGLTWLILSRPHAGRAERSVATTREAVELRTQLARARQEMGQARRPDSGQVRFGAELH